MEVKIKTLIRNVFSLNEDDEIELNRFNIGMSNYSYLFKVNNEKYVVRVQGQDTYKFVNYYQELNSISAANNLNLTNELIYFDVNSGTKISKYIEGSHFEFFKSKFNVNTLVERLKQFHNIKNDSLLDYQLIERLNLYESYNLKEDLNNKYFEIKNWWIELYNKNYINRLKVFCHNDLQTVNIISNNNNIYFLDLEYAAYNDIYYDFACFEDNAYFVLEKYFNRKIKKEEIFDIKFYQIYQSLQWYNVALYKDKIGFSKTFNYNFLELASYFINNAYRLYKILREVVASEIK